MNRSQLWFRSLRVLYLPVAGLSALCLAAAAKLVVMINGKSYNGRIAHNHDAEHNHDDGHKH